MSQCQGQEAALGLSRLLSQEIEHEYSREPRDASRSR